MALTEADPQPLGDVATLLPAPVAFRAGASDPVFLGSVLDFILMDDAWVIEFSEAAGIAPEKLGRARQALPGGEAVNWT